MQGGSESHSAGGRAALVWVHALLVLATALLFQRVWLQRANTLHDNGSWESSKVSLEYGILGAVAFVTTRTALHRDRLDLGVWHGYHEVLRREPVSPAVLSARLRLRGPGYLVVLVDRVDDSFTGVRVSTDPAFPAACLHGDGEGRFLAREDLAIPLLDASWYRVTLTRREDSWAVALDGRDVGSCQAVPAKGSRIGFRSGAADHAWVDDVVLTDEQGRVWSDDFRNRRNSLTILGVALAGVIACHGLVLLVTSGSRRRQGLGATPYVFTTHVVLLAVAGLSWTIDTALIAPRHPEDVDFRGHVTTFERRRDVVERLAGEVVSPRPANVYRILALGGSQTWASGARDRDDAWFEQLEAKLAKQAAPGQRIEVIGAGIPAYKVEQLYELFARTWIDFEPDVLLLNVGHNDKDAEELTRFTRAIAELAAKHGIRTVVVPEANSVENRSSLEALYVRHDALRQVAAELGLSVIEVHEWLAERRDDGFLWWDRVHLTPAGQALLAERLYQERTELLGR